MIRCLTVVSEVDRLLAGRTRDIRLNAELARLFHARSWPQASKILRAWMVWVVVLDVLTLAVNAAPSIERSVSFWNKGLAAPGSVTKASGRKATERTQSAELSIFCSWRLCSC